jgi:hypothetical protein
MTETLLFVTLLGITLRLRRNEMSRRNSIESEDKANINSVSDISDLACLLAFNLNLTTKR